MTDTRKRHRTPITFDPAILKWLEDNQRANGHATVSKFANSIISEYVKSKTAPPEPEQEGPLTPDQEVDKITEEMGSLNEQYDEKFEAIRALIPKDAPDVETVADLKRLTEMIWKKLMDKNGFIRGSRNKAVAISREDLKCYEKLGMRHLRKKELMKNIAIVESITETQ